MHKRLKKVCTTAGWLLGAGLVYILLCLWWGGPVLPCPFRAITGLRCPGCGISHLCLALIRLDFAGAWEANPAVLLLLLPGLSLAGALIVRYVKTGNARLKKSQSVLVYAMIGILLVFGVVRNILGLF